MYKDTFLFPVFKRHRHGRTWMRIDSPDSMTEVRVLGGYYNVMRIEARILPERVMIADLLEDSTGALETVTGEDYEDFLAECVRSRVLREF